MTLIDQCLAQDPAARPTAKQIVQQLERMGVRQRAEVRRRSGHEVLEGVEWGGAGCQQLINQAGSDHSISLPERERARRCWPFPNARSQPLATASVAGASSTTAG